MNVTLTDGRRLLAAVSAMVAVLALACAVPGAAATARAKAPIRHVVVIYLENHSFDNLLGFWCRQHSSRCPDGGMPASVSLSNGAVVAPGVSPNVVPAVRHMTIDQQNAIDGGRMDGWQKIPGCDAASGYACVSGYKPSQEPNLALLASDFAISDETFSMQDSPSWFGHLYAVAASTDGFTGNPGGNPVKAAGVPAGNGWGCDSNKVAQWGPSGQRVPSCVPDPALTALPNGGAFEPTPVPYTPTIMDRLSADSLGWRIYGGQCGRETVAANGLETCSKMAAGTTPLGYGWGICPTFAECLYSNQGQNVAPDAQFIPDASNGRLPALSVVTPGNGGVSEHNGFSMTAGDNWLGRLVSAVMNGPQWNSTAVFITWDDCGCFYDQVPPGINPDGTRQGPRVPLIIVSPYAKPGYTDTTATTFAGILAYTEHTFGLAPLGVNDAHAYPFTNAFNYAQTPLQPRKMVTRPLPASARHIHPTPAELNDPT